MNETSLLDRLLRPGALRVLFQPVFELSAPRRVHMIEALSRGPEDSNMGAAPVLFEYVRRKGKEAVVDRRCVASALEAARRLRRVPRLSLNVHAATLERDADFSAFLLARAEEAGFPPERLVLEIVEHAPSWGGARFLAALDVLRERGVLIAMDDVGLGQSNFRMILESRPDYFKLDRFLVAGCSADFRRRAVVDALLQLAGKLGARVVAEGIEEAADLDALEQLGVELVQGYLLCRPMAPEDLEALA